MVGLSVSRADPVAPAPDRLEVKLRNYTQAIQVIDF